MQASQATVKTSKIIKINADSFTDFIDSSFNNSSKSPVFQSFLKLADITPVYKTGDRNAKDNYRQFNI